MVKLSDHLGNVHSQHGEDGALSKLFEVVGLDSGYFVEFGAWDGEHLSNTRALAEKGWKGCLIEGDKERYQDLLRSPRSGVETVCRYVTVDGPDSLDAILSEVGAPETVDLLSIDIDSDDLATWRSVQTHRARCVVIEYNPTIPFDCRFENPPGRQWGNSALSLAEFAQEAGYALVCVTATNLVFYDRSAPGSEAIESVDLMKSERGTRCFWGYDGTFLRQTGTERSPEDYAPEMFRVPWTRFVTVQPIPRALRGYIDNASSAGHFREGIGLALACFLRPVTTGRAFLGWLAAGAKGSRLKR
jgi:hypothetical protein